MRDGAAPEMLLSNLSELWSAVGGRLVEWSDRQTDSWRAAQRRHRETDVKTDVHLVVGGRRRGYRLFVSGNFRTICHLFAAVVVVVLVVVAAAVAVVFFLFSQKKKKYGNFGFILYTLC